MIYQDGFSWIKSFLNKSDNEELKERLNAYLQKVIHSDIEFAKFISSMIGHSKGAGDFYYDIWNVDLKYMEQYFEINNAVKRMISFIHDEKFKAFGQYDKENIIAFLTFCEMKDGLYAKDVTRDLMESFAAKNNIQLTE